MRASERHEKILQLLKEKGNITINDLKESIPNVSEVTFRRDLLRLSEENKLIRTYGGARAVDMINIFQEEEFKQRLGQNADSKRTIAAKAITLLGDNDRIYLDSGSTCTFIAMQMEDKPYDITTNGLTCAMELARLTQPRITMVGGNIYKGSYSTTGDVSTSQIENQFWDIAFIGTMGYVSGKGFMSSVVDDHVFKRRIVHNSKKVVIVMDHTKVGKWGTHLIAKLPEVYAVISDNELPKEMIEEFKKQNILVL